MGTYLNVESVEHLGKPIQAKRGKSQPKISPEQPKIPSEHRLIVVVNNGAFKFAGDVTKPYEYQQFFDAYNRGRYEAAKLLLLENDKVAACS